MVQKENFEKHDARAMSLSVQIWKKPSALADGVVTPRNLMENLQKYPLRVQLVAQDDLEPLRSYPLQFFDPLDYPVQHKTMMRLVGAI